MNTSVPGPTIEAFESLDFDAGRFDHQAHVYVAWSYLQQCELLEAIGRYRKTLKRLTSSLGVPEKYHETITWFYMIAVSEHSLTTVSSDWPAFRAKNPELFERSPAVINRFYSESKLKSNEARRSFVLPDLKQSFTEFH